ncbi:hypothetical protein TKK_0011052 [Trichogramma kaykai]|uniref:Uncharacterized protein n=1 Tax=Trichogramma kaykai TaxID=54128 RepID=A0ABD2WVN3_9HYME
MGLRIAKDTFRLKKQKAALEATPAYLLFGKSLNRPEDWRLLPETSHAWKERIIYAQQAQQKYQASYQTTTENKIPYKPRDSVYVKTHYFSSLSDKFPADLE